MRVALERLEPLGRVSSAVLELQYFEVSLGLIFVECSSKAQPRPVQHLRELDRILKRKLGPRADREMRCMSRVAEQDDVAAGPALALDPAEVEPGGASDEVRCVRLQGMAIEIAREQLLAGRYAFVLGHPIEAEPSPRIFGTFDDEGRTIGSEAIAVRPDPAVLRVLEGKGEGVKHLRRSQPDELVRAHVDVDTECVSAGVPEARVGAVRRDDEIIVAPLWIGGIALGFEAQRHAEFTRATLEDLEQTLASDPDEPMPARRDRLASKVHVDIVPMCELFGDLSGRDRIVAGDVLDREIGEDNAPAECHPARVAFEDLDL